jgi:hypothetical protein
MACLSYGVFCFWEFGCGWKFKLNNETLFKKKGGDYIGREEEGGIRGNGYQSKLDDAGRSRLFGDIDTSSERVTDIKDRYAREEGRASDLRKEAAEVKREVISLDEKMKERLEELGIGQLDYDIGYRGGTLGFRSSAVAAAFGIDENLLPRHIGAYVNYLGGGLRGAICISTYSPKIIGKKKELLDELLAACKRAYEDVENEAGLNDDEYEDGETNYEAQGTKAARAAGIKTYPGL